MRIEGLLDLLRPWGVLGISGCLGFFFGKALGLIGIFGLKGLGGEVALASLGIRTL